MASLKQFSRICSFDNAIPSKHTLISHAIDNEHILVTSNNKHIGLWEIQSQRLVSSWSVRSGQEITTCAVADPTSQGYAAVLNKQNVHCWKPEDKSIEKAKKIKLGEPVHSLLSVAGRGVLAVLSSGAVLELQRPDAVHGEPSTETVHHAAATLFNQGLVVVVWQGAGVRVYDWGKEGMSPTITQHNISNSSDMLCQCIHTRQNQLYALQIERSGLLSEVCVAGSNAGDSTALHVVDSLSTNVCMASLGEAYVAVAGVNVAGGGVAIWDLKFGHLQKWQPFPELTTAVSQVIVLGGKLVVCSDVGVYLYPFQSQPSTLGAALGKYAGCSKHETDKKTTEAISQVLVNLADRSKTPTLASFTAEFSTLVNNWSSDCCILAHQPLCQLIKRCLREKDFWPAEQLTTLIKNGHIPQSVHLDLFTSLSARMEYGLISLCLQKLEDIPEAALVEAVQTFVNAEESKLADHFEKDMTDGEEEPIEEATSPFTKERAAFINCALCKPYNEVFLLQALRKLNVDQSLVLLEYLHYLIHQAPMTSSDKRPSLAKVVDWLNLLVDSHFSELVLTPAARKALLLLHQTVGIQVRWYDELVSLGATLCQIKDRSVVPYKQNPGQYNIHVLHVA